MSDRDTAIVEPTTASDGGDPEGGNRGPLTVVWESLKRAGRALRRLRAFLKRWPWVSVLIIVFVLIVPAILAPWLTSHDPLRGDLALRLKPPAWLGGGSWEFPLGTDKQGRDILTRMIFGSRISLMVAGLTVVAGATIGSVLGIMAGYFGGMTDKIISWLVDVSLSLPYILLALVIVSIIGPSFTTICIILTFTMWSYFARQARGETLSIREQEYVARARVAGVKPGRIMFRYVLPNLANSLIVLATLNIGRVILLESSLSFIGAGIPRPNPSWGVMVADGRDYVLTAWWLSLLPGVAILLVVMAVNLLGDWLRDYLDPKLKQRA